ncbi:MULTISPECIES: glycosyltransferase family 4 protein [Pseudomonas syringae group]|uniref:Glycosyl transferase family 1 n=4 Tax=Pseudomonas syringae group TaxID=136849 RepID=A0ABY1U539_PSESX|nr:MULTISPECIES: glycosyltransferase family 4 protein [Pseudomonas syringae group]KPW28210.1 Glycosyl transferase, group 1 family protein [Pseudomonas syringae pv. apii]KPW45698.1 Glycosyl transferase, group 1 family protein [Pseudomonas syringae pv. berberidis]KPY28085.1 Glycosyl transferase, group 1 family protein [Pseudomonas syringae pv. philadelphi]KTB99607.1 glycosyl transferase family 1 [Pseudomonas syringae ICMP 11292]KWT11900.1 glycosyl transferase family 1 [Pseudomonas syringae pv. a
MKILFISSLYAPDIGGGAEIILQRTVEGLQQRGYSIAVLATTDRPGLQLAEVNRVKVYRAGLLNQYWHFMPQRPGRLARFAWHWRDRYNGGMRDYVRQVIELEQPELVVCHNLTGWSVSAWDEITRANRPVVQVLHDLYLLCPSSTMFKKGQSCQRQCSLCTQFRKHHAQQSEQVSTVVGVSRFMLDTLQAQGYFKGARGYVVHNASPFTPPHAGQTKAADDTAPLRFGYLGTLSENKGVGWLINQFQHLPFKATLQIAGRGQSNDEKRFRAMATSPDISFVGFQKPEDFYQHIDVAIVPSMWNEPFGLVAVEACAHSRPVIASRMGGLPEIIQDQLNGLLCSPDDPDSLGLAMLKLHQQPELLARLGSQARNSVASLLNLDLMLDQYESIFAQTLQDRSTWHGERVQLDPG